MPKMALKVNNKRSCYWSSVFYPDSCPLNVFEIIKDLKIKYAISPLHCDDLDADGNIKKPHYHVILVFDSLKSYSQVSEICKMFGAVSPQIVISLRGYIRYLVHLDDADKAQYNKDDITANFDLDRYFMEDMDDLTIYDKTKITKDILKFIKEQGITEFFQLVDYCSEYNETWLSLLMRENVYFIERYISSVRFMKLGSRE